MRLLLDTNTLNYILKDQPLVVERLDEAMEKGESFLLASVMH